MVLERLFKTEDLLRKPLLLFIYSAIVLVVAALTSYVFFEEYSSVLVVAFVTIAFTHFIHSTYRITEKQTNTIKGFWKRYDMVIVSYVKIFIALVIVFALMYVLLPQQYRLILFKDQIATLSNVSTLRANIVAIAGHFFKGGVSSFIFINNLEVLLGIILLSFLYGAGAIFLIAYQSSILGAIVGENILNVFGYYNNLGIYGHIFAILHGSYLSLGVLPHGIFEILAYFFGAIAGGIISAAITGHYAQSKKMVLITVRDVFILIVLAVLFLAIGAVIEAYLLLG